MTILAPTALEPTNDHLAAVFSRLERVIVRTERFRSSDTALDDLYGCPCEIVDRFSRSGPQGPPPPRLPLAWTPDEEVMRFRTGVYTHWRELARASSSIRTAVVAMLDDLFPADLVRAN